MHWTNREKEELARDHIEYEVRKLIEYVRELEGLPKAADWVATGHGAIGQALLDASLIHLRNLHEFLHPDAQNSDSAYARLYSDSWTKHGFLDGREYGRVSAKVAHLSHSRLRFKLDDWQPHEIPPLAVRCCEHLREFFDGVRPEWSAAFAKPRDDVEDFLASQTAS